MGLNWSLKVGKIWTSNNNDNSYYSLGHILDLTCDISSSQHASEWFHFSITLQLGDITVYKLDTYS